MKETLKVYRDRVKALEPSIDAGIEQHRKSDATIRIVDRKGNPVSGAQITINQKSHDFLFGCNGLCIGQKGDMNDYYEQEFARLFNLVTSTACWSVTETSEGHFRFTEADGDISRRPPIDRILSFAKKYNLKVKLQPLMCERWCPDWASDNPEELKAQWTHFLKVMANRYANKVDYFDVVNESMLCAKRTPNFPLWNEDLDFVDWCFEQAAKYFPEKHGNLELNEATHINWGEKAQTYYNIAKRILDKKLPLESIGFQFHMFKGETCAAHLKDEYLPMAECLDTYRQFGNLGVPLSISEVTVPSRFPDCTAQEGEQIQAEVVRNLYRMWFAQPEIDSIIYWNFMDGAHWSTEGDCLGCLLDANFQEKPSYHALYQLIHRDWKTRTSLVADENGEVRFRGFHGDYELIVDAASGHRVLTMGVHKDDTNCLTITL